MTTRIGINGFGRIGRAFVRRCLGNPELDVVAINDITDAGTLAHLLEFDSTYGRLAAQIEHADNAIVVDGKQMTVLSTKDPAGIDWGRLGVDSSSSPLGSSVRGTTRHCTLRAGPARFSSQPLARTPTRRL